MCQKEVARRFVHQEWSVDIAVKVTAIFLRGRWQISQDMIILNVWKSVLAQTSVDMNAHTYVTNAKKNKKDAL